MALNVLARPVRRRVTRRTVFTIALVVFLVWSLFPILWILETSFKTSLGIYGAPSLWPKTFTGSNYSQDLTDPGFRGNIANSLIVAAATTLLSILIAVPAAYALTRLRFRGRNMVSNLTVAVYLVPPTILFVPLFEVAQIYGISDKALGLVPVYLIFSVPFCTWLVMSHMLGVPRELEEAALVDGASRLQSLRRVVLPLVLPSLAVVSVFAFTQSWNEFLFALILISDQSQQTLPVGLSNFLSGDVFEWGPLMAGGIIASIPPVLIYLAAQRWIVSGLMTGGVKG